MNARIKAHFVETENIKTELHEDKSLQSTFNESQNVQANFNDDEALQADFAEEEQLRAGFGTFYEMHTDNYDDLYNKPIHQNTTEFWDAQPQLIAKKDNLYFYTDYQTAGGKNIAGLKLGDGSSFLIDLPFLDAVFEEHINNRAIHITQQEREFWNKKNRAVVAGENLVLTEL